MDGILQFLLIVGIIVIGVVKQFKKEAKKNAENRPAMPVPENDIDESALPIPEAWGNTYGGFIPEGPAPKIPSVPTEKEEYQFSASKHIFGGDSTNTSPKHTTTHPKQKISPPLSTPQNLKPIPNTPFIRQKKRGKPSSGRKYYNGSIE